MNLICFFLGHAPIKFEIGNESWPISLKEATVGIVEGHEILIRVFACRRCDAVYYREAVQETRESNTLRQLLGENDDLRKTDS